MRIALLLIALGTATEVALARSSGRPSSSAPRRSRNSSSGSGSSRGGSSGRSGSKGGGRRRDPIADDSDDEDPLGFDVEDDAAEEYDDYDEEEYAAPPPPRRGSRGPPPQQRRRPPPRAAAAARFDDYDEDEYDDEYAPPPSRRGGSRGGRGGPPPPSSRGGSRGRGRGPPPSRRGGEGRVVSYNQPRGRRGGPPPPSTFTRGLSAIRDKMPDPGAVKDTMLSATKAAQERTSQLSSNIYREVKGLTSSELEQVMLKSTRPDETPVKTKHVERLVGVTYQISGKYDIYDAVLRKLWNKMAEKDIRTKLKSVYVLHRFSVDGSPDHQEALKQRLRALRKTKDPKRSSGGGRGGTRYFDSKVLIGQDNDPETQGFRAFISRYAHYVLTRAQTFGGIFNEISLAQTPPPPPSKKGRSKSKSSSGSAKPKNPPLCEEHLKFAQMVLKAGLACTLHEGEDSESTAMCVERVAADLMGLTAAVAVALKRELKSQSGISEDSEELVKQWCEFYSEELLPETKKFCKKVTGKLDAYGLYLPSRISSSLSQELLEKGLKMGGGGGDEKESAEEDEEEEEEGDAANEEQSEEVDENSEEMDKADAGDASIAMSSSPAAASTQEDEDEYDEYEYDEYDEYDD
ncbi:hypothetical protein ACHAXR_012786 [Thalassiosira sp. AJA248-18]